MHMMPRAMPSVMCGWGMRHMCQVLGVVQRTVQNNGSMNSEPKYLACEESPIDAFYY